MNGIIFGLEEECRRRVGTGINPGGERGECRRLGKVRRIDADDEVRPGAHSGCFGRFVGALEVRMISEHDNEVTSGGESEDADAMGIEAPLGSMGTRDAHGLLSVFEIFRVLGEALCNGNPVLGKRAVDADGVEPGADLCSLKVIGKNAITSAGKYDDGDSGIVRCGGGIEREGWLADIGHMSERTTTDQPIGWLGDVGFRPTAVWLRDSLGPKRQSYLLGPA